MALYVGNTKYKVMVGNQTEDFKVPLPYDAQVEYLQSSETQWIDTSIIPNSTTKITIEFETTKVSGSGTYGIFGCRASANSKSFLLMQSYQSSAQKFRFDYGGAATTASTVSSGWHEVYNNGNSVNIDGSSYSGGSWQTTTLPIYLFAINQNGSVNFKHIGLKIKSFKIESNNSTVLDYIPVRVGQVGYMYDKISGQLFGNAGTGSFILGKDKTLPYDAEVEYLESSGTQWINTGFNSISENTNFQVCFMNLEGSATGKCVFGSRQAFSTKNVSLWCAADSAGKVRAIKGTYNNPNNYDKSITNADYVSNVSITGRDVSWEVNGSTTTWTLPSSTFTSSIPIHVFSLNNNGSPGISNGWGATIKLYYFKIFTGTTLSMDFIPVRKDGVGYLYDKVSGQLFGNEGTGSFVIGPDVCIKPKYDAEVEWLEFTGLQAINTGIYPTSLDITMEYTSYNHPKWGWAYNGDADKTWICSGGTRIYWHNWNTSYRYDISDYNANTRNTWKYDMQNGFWKNNTKVSTFSASISSTQISSIPLYIGQYWDLSINSIYDATPVNAKVSHWKISKGGILVRDYIPVRKDGIGYLYDKVSGTLFGNAGSGAFTYGNDVTTDIYTIMEKMYTVRAIDGFSSANFGWEYDFVYGHTYRIIVKVKIIPSGSSTSNVYLYQNASNNPNIFVIAFNSSTPQTQEIIYTHNVQNTYHYIGAWGNAGNTRDGRGDFSIYIEEI